MGPDGVLAHKTVANTAEGWASLRAWAAPWEDRAWAVEGSGALGRGVAQFLAERGERVHEVSPKWTAQRRRTMRKPGKSDRLDAHAVARLLREEAATLPVVRPEEQEAASVELWSRLREDVVAGMTQLRNRLVVHQERELRANIQRAVAEHFGPLTTIEGVGPPVAAGLIAELGAPRSGFGIPQLAALAGVAPLEASSAGGVRHRLNRLGNRRLNSLLYHIAIVQARCYVPARAYLARRQQEGRTPKEARRALKRQLVRSLWHHWQACWSAKSTTSPAIAPSLAS